MPASAAEPSEDADILKGVECLEQDDDDEAYPEVNMSEATEFFFCHQTAFQRHLLYR